jgi:hypothetical protein
MTKMLEMIGLGFVAIMILGFVGSLQSIGIPMGASNPYFLGMCRWNSNYYHI